MIFNAGLEKQGVSRKHWHVKTANESTGWNGYKRTDVYRAVSVHFNASRVASWWVENVNFMPYRLWLKSLMDTCLEHDRLISVFSSGFLSISAWAFLSFNGNGKKGMEKAWTRWDIRPLIGVILLSHCVYLSGSTKCMLHIDAQENALRHLDCSCSCERDNIIPLICDDTSWFNDEKKSPQTSLTR